VRTELGESSDIDFATLQFGVSEEERSRYTELMNEIAGLEREAKAVRDAEAAAAVRWIRKAIAEYGISASELGLRFDYLRPRAITAQSADSVRGTAWHMAFSDYERLRRT
jgi:hypothetical protein